jgi:putative membrane protein
VYEWLKALHIISVISWMAGLLYLPRLFVYHVGSEKRSVQSETFKVMERRLMKAIMTPAMVASWGFGLALIWSGGFFSGELSIWLIVKLVCVVLLTFVHFYMVKLVKVFAADENTRSAGYFRVLNEAPTVLMLMIVIFVVVKPF